jgi:eukaryotic-like serine/threonine-protein kinase
VAEFEDPPRETRRDPGVARAERPASETRRDPDHPSSSSPPSTSASASTRRDGPAPPPGDSLVRLPGTLAQRFTVLGELPVQGAESDLLHVRDASGTDHVVKIFRRGYGADREVWRKLPDLDSPHVVRIVETGHADGRDYEVIEYAPAGNLRSLMTTSPPRHGDTAHNGPPLADAPLIDPPLIDAPLVDVVSQLATGLDRLHRAGIVHRDLKPENVLVASVRPLRLAITDFGLSKVIEQSVVFASSSRTLAYAAPESLSGQVSPARDWWSLGMIVRELATGRPPFLGLSETVVVDHLATRPIDNDDIDDPRVRLLCQGLLTRDPRRRWSGTQVTEWLDGASPAVATESARPAREPRTPAGSGSGSKSESESESGPGLPFAGRRYTDRAELARALVENWDTAARYFFARGAGSEAWRSLRDWLAEFDDDSRIELVDTHLNGSRPPDVKLLHLVRWLDAAAPPHYLGRRITADDLPGLAALAGDATHADHRTATVIGRSLWEDGLLPVLAGFAGGAELGEIDARWRGRVKAWNQLAGWLHGQLPPPVNARLPEAGAPGRDDPPVVLLTLLALAARPAETSRALAEAAARARSCVPEPTPVPVSGPVSRPVSEPVSEQERPPDPAPVAVPWFTWLADSAGDDPLRLLAVVRTAPDAVLEAEARLREREAAERQTADRQRHWEETERRRRAGRRSAVLRAVLWTLPLLAIWLLGSWLITQLFSGGGGVRSVGGLQRSEGVPPVLLLTLSGLAWAVECGAEVLLAGRQGTDYLPFGPWSWLSRVLGAGSRGLSSAARTMSGTARRTGPRGCGLLLLVGILPLLLVLIVFSAMTAFVWALWLMVIVVTPLGHVIGVGIRLYKWRQSREPARREAVRPGTGTGT